MLIISLGLIVKGKTQTILGACLLGQATDLGYTFPKKLGHTYDKELGQSLSCLRQRAWLYLCQQAWMILVVSGYVLLRVAACAFAIAINLDTHDLGTHMILAWLQVLETDDGTWT